MKKITKNKFILAFLLIPVVIACQNTVNVSNSSSPNPNKSNVNTNNISPSPTGSVSNLPSAIITPSSTTQPITSDIQESTTPIIESNIVPEIKIDNLPEIPKEFLVGEYKQIQGFVYDKSKKPIADVDVMVLSKRIYKYTYSTKTNDFGKYIVIIPNKVIDIIGSFYVLTVSKNDFTKNFSLVNTKYSDMIFNFGGEEEYQPSKEISYLPEIQNIKINNNKVINYKTQYYYRNISIRKYGSYFLNKDIDLPRFKLESIDNLRLELKFNNSIIRNSIENNLIIESLDKTIKYDSNTKNSKFIWLDDNKRVIFECPIQELDKDVKYKIYFKEPFVDSNNNKAYQGEYISLDVFTFNYVKELSENIVFEIAGNKGE